MKDISRRDFLRYCGIGAATLGLTMTDLIRLEKILANPTGPSVIWLQGSGCTGCSESFLNRISATSPKTAVNVLVDAVNLIYHPTLMALAGESAVDEVEAIYKGGNFILAVEGGVPTALNGNTCWAWTHQGVETTFRDAVLKLAGKASQIISIGTCAAWGGMAAAPPNPTMVKGVQAATGKKTINVAGCPPHPDWMVWTMAQLILNNPVALDRNGRPTAIFAKKIHDQCPRKEKDEMKSFGRDGGCLKELGCRGPETRGNCPVILWNNKANWCVDANAPCIGCTEPTFPGTNAFYKNSDGD